MLAQLRKEWGPRMFSWVPLDFWHRLMGFELLMPFYHLIGDGEVPHVSGLYRFRNIQQFKSDLNFFLKSYTPVSLGDVIAHLEGKTPLPRRSFLLSFDDGFHEIHDIVAPILLSQGIPAVFFLTTAVIDNLVLGSEAKKSLLICAGSRLESSTAKRELLRRLDNAGIAGSDLASGIRNIRYNQKSLLDEIAAILECDFDGYLRSVNPYVTSAQTRALLDQGFAIGAHGVDHPLYSQLSLEEQLRQTIESVEWLSNRFQYRCEAFAFPHNDAGVQVEFFEQAFARAGLKVSFGTAAISRHFYPKNLERFTMDVTHLETQEILSREFAVSLLRGHCRALVRN